MRVSSIKSAFKLIQKSLVSLTTGLAFLLMISQYLIISDEMPAVISSHGLTEGVAISQYSDALLVGQTAKQVYYVRMNYHLPNDLPKNAIKVFINHQLVAVLKESSATVAVSNGQILTLDGSLLKEPLEITLYIGNGDQEKMIKETLLPGQLQNIKWMQS